MSCSADPSEGGSSQSPPPPPPSPSLLGRLRKEPARSGALLVSVPVLVALFTYFGSNDFYRSVLSSPQNYSDLHGFIYQHAGCFVILGAGSLVLGGLLGLSPRRLGLRLGNMRFGLPFTAVLVVAVVLPVSYVLSFSPELAREYPEAKSALDSGSRFALHIAVYALYFAGWEMFFRGYMIFGLAERFGAWPAIFIATIPSALIHTSIACCGKPALETFGAIPVGILFGWLAVRTRSVIYPFIIHAAMGLLTDLWQFTGG